LGSSRQHSQAPKHGQHDNLVTDKHRTSLTETLPGNEVTAALTAVAMNSPALHCSAKANLPLLNRSSRCKNNAQHKQHRT
jgi:hypothetical protein